MNTKEKAKRYDEAIEIAKGLYAKDAPDSLHLERIFPELKESEDERTWIINYLSNRILNSSIIAEKENLKKAIAWLEGQGEQKPSDKIEPKFKVGDIITNGKITGKVDKNENNKYHGWFGYDKDLSVHYADIPDVENWHLWTIQDAKDGDVLVSKSGDKIFLYRGNLDLRGRPCAHYGIYKVHDGIRFTPCAIGNYFTYEEVYPATKEQRDTLIKAMADAGYIFDFEKKELKKVEQKP